MSISMEPNYWGPVGRGNNEPPAMPSATVYAQETRDGQWIWWITAANHATLAQSARRYTTERAAINAAKAVAALGDIAVDERNLR